MTVHNFLLGLENVCLTKGESWWTYEVCLGKSVKQVHYSYSITKDSRGEAKPTQHEEVAYSLGTIPSGGLLIETNRVLKNLRENSTESEGNAQSEEAQVARLLKGFSGSAEDNSATGDLPPSLQLEYEDGTPCEVAEQDYDVNLKLDKRSSTVEIICGRSDSILEVREDRTCHYHIKITSRQLCKCPGFAPDDLQYSKVNFYPSNPIDPRIETE